MKKVWWLLCMAPLTAWAQSLPVSPMNGVSNDVVVMPAARGSSNMVVSPSNGVDDYAAKLLEQAQRQAEENGRRQEYGTTVMPTEGNSTVGDSLMPSASVTNQRPPSEEDAQRAAREAWMNDSSQALRQSGQSIEHAPHQGFYVTAKGADRVLLMNWIAYLKNEGVPEEKILFEAKRLSKEDFALWASRFVWNEQFLHPNVVHVSEEVVVPMEKAVMDDARPNRHERRRFRRANNSVYPDID